jgi:hypothetical protein
MEAVVRGLERARRIGQRLGPYLMLEVIMPGGTMFALLLFLHRRGRLDFGRMASRAAAAVSRSFGGRGERQQALRPCRVRSSPRLPVRLVSTREGADR